MKIPALAALLILCSAVQADEPSSQPAQVWNFEPMSPNLNGDLPAGKFDDYPGLKITFAFSEEAHNAETTTNYFSQHLLRLQHTEAIELQLAPNTLVDGVDVADRLVLQRSLTNNSISLSEPALAATLTAAFKLDPSITVEQRIAELPKAHEALQLTERMIEMLSTMLNADQTVPLGDRIRALTKERNALKQDIAAKSRRMGVVSLYRASLEDDGERYRENDAMVDQLRKLVDIRQKKVSLMQEQFKKGVASQSDVIDAQAAEIEAELQLAARKASVPAAGLGTALDQINQEYYKLGLDQREGKARLAAIEEELRPFNLAGATTQSLANAVQVTDAASNAANAAALRKQLEQQLAEQTANLLRLQIVRIEPAHQK